MSNGDLAADTLYTESTSKPQARSHRGRSFRNRRQLEDRPGHVSNRENGRDILILHTLRLLFFPYVSSISRFHLFALFIRFVVIPPPYQPMPPNRESPLGQETVATLPGDLGLIPIAEALKSATSRTGGKPNVIARGPEQCSPGISRARSRIGPGYLATVSKNAPFSCRRMLAFFLILPSVSFADDAGVRSRESFNASWRFARFGPMADRSTRPEPGAERWSIVASASSEETSKGNVSENAFDGDQTTRWCASGGGTGEWLVLDLGRDRKLGRIVVDWEFSDLTYGSAVEVSPDGKAWTAVRHDWGIEGPFRDDLPGDTGKGL